MCLPNKEAGQPQGKEKHRPSYLDTGRRATIMRAKNVAVER
jgi:hypothetical protein